MRLANKAHFITQSVVSFADAMPVADGNERTGHIHCRLVIHLQSYPMSQREIGTDLSACHTHRNHRRRRPWPVRAGDLSCSR